MNYQPFYQLKFNECYIFSLEKFSLLSLIQFGIFPPQFFHLCRSHSTLGRTSLAQGKSSHKIPIPQAIGLDFISLLLVNIGLRYGKQGSRISKSLQQNYLIRNHVATANLLAFSLRPISILTFQFCILLFFPFILERLLAILFNHHICAQNFFAIKVFMASATLLLACVANKKKEFFS